MMEQGTNKLLVLSTCPGSITAKQISQDLVANQLAACVNILPGIQSYFRWGNKVDYDEEYLLIIKTTTDLYPEVEKKINSLHPHELPEIIAVSIQTGLAEYLAWIDDNTK
jgi:periplasmic divalent cation tolerance protein